MEPWANLPGFPWYPSLNESAKEAPHPDSHSQDGILPQAVPWLPAASFLPEEEGQRDCCVAGDRRWDQSPGYACIPTYLLGVRPQLLQPQAGPRLASLTPYFHVLPR